MRIDMSDRQLDKDLEEIKTFGRLYHQLYQNYVQSFIGFVLRFDLDSLSVLIVRDEYRCIADKCTLNRTANLLPRVMFVVELESHGKHNQFVDVYGYVPLLAKSLQRICITWRTNFQGHCPRAYPKLVLPGNVYLVWRGYDQGRGIGEAKPERSVRQLKQGAFTRSEVTFD